jgi:hypothetical protein
MSGRLSRLAPLTGVVFAVLFAVVTLTEKETPEAGASGAKVIAFYTANHSNIKSSNTLLALAFLFFLFFAASLRGYLRRTPAAEPLSALVLAASVLMAAGIAILAGIAFSLAENYSEIQPAAAQVLNLLGNELFFPVVMGACVFGIAAGLAILRGARLPKWLGWVIIVLGVASPTPAAEIALFGLVIWIAVVSILIFLRSAPANAAPSADAPGALGASGG